MKKQFATSLMVLMSFLYVTGQQSLDTLYFVDGKIEAVQLTGLTEDSVQYNYYGEGIPISTPKTRLEKVVTRSGRVVVFENTSKKKTVYSAEDWEKVEITNVESEVEGLIRMGNVSGKAKGTTNFSSLEKLQSRSMTKMRMQAAFLGCDLIFMLNQTNTDSRFGSALSFSQTASSTLSGTAYNVKRTNPSNVSSGTYSLKKVYRLQPNEYELKEISFSKYIQEITLEKNDFIKEEDYYTLNIDTGIPDSNNKMHLIKVQDNELVFLVIDRSKQSKIKYYNLYFSKG
jgi:hypothetical protein